MNKRRIRLKYRTDTVRRTYEPDYDHEAWEAATPPTPDTVPDAFYERIEPAHPKAPMAETRRKPHRSLTTSMLRRRLHSAGVKGLEAKQMLADIMAGEQDGLGIMIPMSWSKRGFRERFGRRVARAVLRFVHVAFIVIDEAWQLLNSPSATVFVEKAMRTCRKVSAVTTVVTQTLPSMSPEPIAVARHISFHL